MLKFEDPKGSSAVLSFLRLGTLMMGEKNLSFVERKRNFLAVFLSSWSLCHLDFEWSFKMEAGHPASCSVSGLVFRIVLNWDEQNNV